jgi:CelD/BcsL family acetyltransferase involved in cellulose biosynthesis
MSATFKVEIAPSFADAFDRWERMIEGGAATLPFQRRDWLAAWAATLGREPGIDVLPITVLNQTGAPVLALPLVRRRNRMMRTITFADGGLTDYNAPIIMPGAPREAAGAMALWRDLRRALPACDLIHFEKMRTEIDGHRNPLAMLAGARASRMAGLALTLSGSYDDWLRALPSHFRKEIGRCGRLFDALPGASFKVSSDVRDDERTALFGALERLQRERIDELGLPYALDQDAPRAFYRLLSGNGHGVLTALMAEQTVVAALFGLRYGSQFVMLRIGIAGDRYRHLSPGRHIITQTMQALAGDGVTDFDFALGDYAYKRKLGGKTVELSELLEARSPLGIGPVALAQTKITLSADTRLGAAARRLKNRLATRR